MYISLSSAEFAHSMLSVKSPITFLFFLTDFDNTKKTKKKNNNIKNKQKKPKKKPTKTRPPPPPPPQKKRKKKKEKKRKHQSALTVYLKSLSYTRIFSNMSSSLNLNPSIFSSQV